MPPRLVAGAPQVAMLQQLSCNLSPGVNAFVIAANDGTSPVYERRAPDGSPPAGPVRERRRQNGFGKAQILCRNAI